jgi:transcriptional regulator with XRE-family HTH domain
MAEIDPRVIFGQRLRELRLTCGVSQETLAAKAGLDRTYVSSCERGKRNISILNIYKIAAALDLDPAELLKQPTTQGL